MVTKGDRTRMKKRHAVQTPLDGPPIGFGPPPPNPSRLCRMNEQDAVQADAMRPCSRAKDGVASMHADLPTEALRESGLQSRRATERPLLPDAPQGRAAAARPRQRHVHPTRVRLTLAQGSGYVPAPASAVCRVPAPGAHGRCNRGRSHRAAQGRPDTILGSEQLATALQVVPQHENGQRGWAMGMSRRHGGGGLNLCNL